MSLRLALWCAGLLAVLATFQAWELSRRGRTPPEPVPAASSPGYAQATAPPARIEIPFRGSLQERQMSRGVFIAGVSLDDVVASEAAFTQGLRLFRDYLETRDRAVLERALAEFRRTDAQPLNRFRRYSFYYQAYCAELLGDTRLKDLYVAKGWVTPSLYEFFFQGDQPKVSRFLLASLCRENAESLGQARKLYRADHGSPPEALQGLVPAYVDRVPTCPATGQETYAVKGDEVVCDRHERAELFDEDGFVYWTILEDYAEQHRFFVWNPLLRKAAGLKPGDVVADLGCGRGLFTFSLARDVGPAGKVFAVDLNPGVLRYVDFERRKHPGLRVQTIRGTERDVRLPAGSVDAAFLVAVYHVLVPEDDPRDAENLRRNVLPWLRTVRAALKPGGLFLVQDGRIDPEIVREQVCQAGFEYLPERILTPKQEQPSLSVFRKPQGKSRATRNPRNSARSSGAP